MKRPRTMNQPLARRMERMQRSTIREILKITARKDVISFAGGLPAPELFPLEHFAAAMREAFDTWKAGALQYDVTEGFLPLKEFLCRWIAQTRPSGASRPENMMLTNGSQQALDLLEARFCSIRKGFRGSRRKSDVLGRDSGLQCL